MARNQPQEIINGPRIKDRKKNHQYFENALFVDLDHLGKSGHQLKVNRKKVNRKKSKEFENF